MEIWYEITQDGLGKNSKELQQESGTSRASRQRREEEGKGRKTKRRGHRSLGTQEAVSGSNAAERPDKVRTENGLLGLPKLITGNCKKPQGGHG